MQYVTSEIIQQQKEKIFNNKWTKLIELIVMLQSIEVEEYNFLI